MNNDEYIDKEYTRLKNQQNGPKVFDEPTSILRSNNRDNS